MKKAIVTIIVFAVVGAAALLAASAAGGSVPSVERIGDASACPVTGCASGECHGYEDVPAPDGTSLMTCPTRDCQSVECHGWESISGYSKASDASLNLWILAPVLLTAGLVLVLKKV